MYLLFRFDKQGKSDLFLIFSLAVAQEQKNDDGGIDGVRQYEGYGKAKIEIFYGCGDRVAVKELHPYRSQTENTREVDHRLQLRISEGLDRGTEDIHCDRIAKQHVTDAHESCCDGGGIVTREDRDQVPPEKENGENDGK